MFDKIVFDSLLLTTPNTPKYLPVESVTEVAVVGKLNDVIVPVVLVKYCKHPGGPAISSVQVYCNAFKGKILSRTRRFKKISKIANQNSKNSVTQLNATHNYDK